MPKNAFGVEVESVIFKMAWDEKNTPKYWKLKAMAEGGKTPEEKAAFKAKLDEYTAKHGEGKGGPDPKTKPSERATPGAGGRSYTPPPSGNAGPHTGNAGGYARGGFKFEDFMGDWANTMREEADKAQRARYERASRHNEWMKGANEKVNNWQRSEWGGKTQSERRAAWKAKPNIKTAWNVMPKTNKMSAGAYVAAGAAMAGGGAYVHHKNPNKKFNVKKIDQPVPWKKYSRGEKASYLGSTAAGLGGSLGSLAAYDRNQYHVGRARSGLIATETLSSLGDQKGATATLDSALTHTKKAANAKKLFHGGNAATIAGIGGMMLTAQHAQNRVKAKKALRKKKVAP